MLVVIAVVHVCLRRSNHIPCRFDNFDLRPDPSCGWVALGCFTAIPCCLALVARWRWSSFFWWRSGAALHFPKLQVPWAGSGLRHLQSPGSRAKSTQRPRPRQTPSSPGLRAWGSPGQDPRLQPSRPRVPGTRPWARLWLARSQAPGRLARPRQLTCDWATRQQLIYLLISLFVCLLICLFVGLFVCLLICSFVCLFICLFGWLVGWLVCLFVCLLLLLFMFVCGCCCCFCFCCCCC